MSTFTPPIRRVNHGRGHRYVDADGTRVPGVTAAVDAGRDLIGEEITPPRLEVVA